MAAGQGSTEIHIKASQRHLWAIGFQGSGNSLSYSYHAQFLEHQELFLIEICKKKRRKVIDQAFNYLANP